MNKFKQETENEQTVSFEGVCPHVVPMQYNSILLGVIPFDL